MLIQIKVEERLQIQPYLLKETFNEVFSCLRVACILFPEFMQIFSTFIVADSLTLFIFNYSRVLSKIGCTTSPKLHAIPVIAHGEDFLTGDVYHFPEKCSTEPDLFERPISVT